MDLPFDELYHKEKHLIDNIVKAQKALDEKQAKLPNPFESGRIFKDSDIPTELADFISGTESQFIND